MAIHGCQHERRDAELAARPRVDFGAVAQQQLDDAHVAAGRGQAQRRVVRHVTVLEVRAFGDQKLHHLMGNKGQGREKLDSCVGSTN